MSFPPPAGGRPPNPRAPPSQPPGRPLPLPPGRGLPPNPGAPFSQAPGRPLPQPPGRGLPPNPGAPSSQPPGRPLPQPPGGAGSTSVAPGVPHGTSAMRGTASSYRIAIYAEIPPTQVADVNVGILLNPEDDKHVLLSEAMDTAIKVLLTPRAATIFGGMAEIYGVRQQLYVDALESTNHFQQHLLQTLSNRTQWPLMMIDWTVPAVAAAVTGTNPFMTNGPDLEWRNMTLSVKGAMFEQLRLEASAVPPRVGLKVLRWTVLVRILVHEMGHVFMSFLAATVAKNYRVRTPTIGEMTISGSSFMQSKPESGWYLEANLFGGSHIGLPEPPDGAHIEVVQLKIPGLRSLPSQGRPVTTFMQRPARLQEFYNNRRAPTFTDYMIQSWCEPLQGTNVAQSIPGFQSEWQATFGSPFPLPAGDQNTAMMNQVPQHIVNAFRTGLRNPQKRVNVDQPERRAAPPAADAASGQQMLDEFRDARGVPPRVDPGGPSLQPRPVLGRGRGRGRGAP